jgi:1-acyl-sn-glycerol-3-phosphate acyltransferase
MVFLWARSTITGLKNITSPGPSLIVTNHLGDADLILGFALTPINLHPIVKIELYSIPLLGKLLEWYGVIWIRRGQPDRSAIKVILDTLQDGFIVGIAPEGRESLTGGLEEGTTGAAYLALKANVPLIPATFTGTENSRVFRNMKRFRRTDISLTIGSPFRLEQLADRRKSIQIGTETIMRKLAEQLPPQYRGVYAENDRK